MSFFQHLLQASEMLYCSRTRGSPQQSSLQPSPVIGTSELQSTYCLITVENETQKTIELTASLPGSHKKKNLNEQKTTTESDNAWEFDYPVSEGKLSYSPLLSR